MQKPLEREHFFYCRIVSSISFAGSRLLGHSFFQPNRFGDQAIDEQGLVDLLSPSKDHGGLHVLGKGSGRDAVDSGSCYDLIGSAS
jgi:hypothetical protein